MFYLGFTLNAKLSWTPHMESRLAKDNNCVMIFSQTIGTQLGISPKTMRWVYSAIIRPIISYVSTVWCDGLVKSTSKKILNTIQRKACVALSGAFHSAPTASLEMLVGLPPLDLHKMDCGEMSTSGTLLLTAVRWTCVTNTCNQLHVWAFRGIWYRQCSTVFFHYPRNEDCPALPCSASQMSPRSLMRLVQGFTFLRVGWARSQDHLDATPSSLKPKS